MNNQLLDFADQNEHSPGNATPPFYDVPSDSQAKHESTIGKSLQIGLPIGLFLFFATYLLAPHIREWGYAIRTLMSPTLHASNVDLQTLQKQHTQLPYDIAQLKRKKQRLVPFSAFLIISSSDNTFTLMQGRQVIRQGVCSTGNNVLLKTSDNRQWLFRTPTGVLRIQDKIESPIWKKPDWAFIEEGKPVPSADARERFDVGALGEYGLYLGQGYLIHGTLYQRMLGIPVTHGCIRLGDDDLESVYRKLAIGAKVFIY